MKTIAELKKLKESEDHVEFKKGQEGNISYNGGSYSKPSDRRRCILGYVTALCNEGGGLLVIGMTDKYPHEVAGTKQSEGCIGELEAKIYADTGIRAAVYELYENSNRVLVIEAPNRPAGRVFKFEDVALMRVGEELRPMSDEVYLKIIQEQEPDFSEQICEGLVINDLDEEAIAVLKKKYATKQKNNRFLTQSDEQILIDLQLLKAGKLTNAALILLGKETVIRERLPQCAVMLEYRNNDSQIHFDNRIPFTKPFFISIDQLWSTINIRNGNFSIQEGPYIFDIPYFNEEVIREAVNNAFTHRDYRRASEIVIKQFPYRLDIVNPGGFPNGVNLDNLLSVPSTPRNRLLADVLQKTGIVERSGQGVDKIFYNTLSEGKVSPDYSQSDNFQVYLSLSALIKDKAFALFIESIQENLLENNKLSVLDIVTLNKIKEGVEKEELFAPQLDSLSKRKLIEKIGRTNGIRYILAKDYYDFTDQKAEYSKLTDWDEDQVFQVLSTYLEKNRNIKMKDAACLFEGRLTRKQVRNMMTKFVTSDRLDTKGKGSGTTYVISEKHKQEMDKYMKAMDIGLKTMAEGKDINNLID